MNEIIATTKFVRLFENKRLDLQFGGELRNVTIAYQTYGELNANNDNVILICHALTGNAHAGGLLQEIETSPNDRPDYLKIYSEMYLNKKGWWSGIIGKNLSLDPQKHFIICTNIIGSCYGSTGPVSINQIDGKPFGKNFPLVSVRDMVCAQKEFLDNLGIKRLKLVLGGSLGGMQTLEWAVSFPEMVNNAICIAAPAEHNPWAIALNEVARQAIFNDPNWNNGDYKPFSVKGLEIARMLGMISYRSPISFDKKFGRSKKIIDNNSLFEVESYLRYQGVKLLKRFDPWSYIIFTYAMDNHDISAGRGMREKILANIKTRILFVGISSDVLYPPYILKELKEKTPNSFYAEIKSDLGHDAFLIEFEQLNRIIRDFMNN